MNRRQLLHSGAAAGLGLVAGPMLNLGRFRLGGQTGPEISMAAADLVLEARAVDMLGLFTLDWEKLFGWFARPEQFGEADYREMEVTGVKVFHPAVETNARDPYSGAMRWMAGWNHLLRSHGCFLSRIQSSADLLLAAERGEIGVVLGFQNSNHFRDVADVRGFYGLGQRISQLTYNETNRLGSGCYVPMDRGLTEFGAEIVEEMNRIGMAVDVSHCGERTSLGAIEASSRPVLITHSNAGALVPGQPRCKSDEVIRRMAKGGGVMGITIVRAFVGASRPTLEDLLDHFDHVARLVGAEHVGLGTDVDVTGTAPQTGALSPLYAIRGLDLRSRVFQIADGLLRRGYGPDAVRSILGGNFRRALNQIWHREATVADVPGDVRRDPFCPAPRTTWSSLRGLEE